MVLHIVNSRANPSYKIAWIIPIMILPLFGLLLYFLFGGNQLTRRQKAKMKNIYYKQLKYKDSHNIVMSELRYENISAYNQVKYIQDYSLTNVCKHTKTTYLSNGRNYYNKIIEAIKSAKKYIFLEYFIIGEGKMWGSILEVLKRKAAQGVDVRVMYDGMGCLTLLPASYPSRLRKMGIKCRVFNPFRPFLSTIQNNRDHRKILVIDGKTAFSGGVNLSDEYVNITAPYGHWKDTAVMLKGKAAFSFTIMFLELWQIAERKRIDDYEVFRPADFGGREVKGYVMPYCDSPFDGELVGETVYMDILSKAKEYVHITTPYMIIDNEMITALGSAAKSGVDVKIIVPHKADHWYAHAVAKAYYAELIARGVKLYEYMPGFIHSKSFVSDGNTAVVGTINMDYRSLYLHFECAVWMYDHPVIGDIEGDFQRTLTKCRPITAESCKVRGARKILYAILRVFAPLM